MFPDLEAIDQVTIDRKASAFQFRIVAETKKVISEKFSTLMAKTLHLVANAVTMIYTTYISRKEFAGSALAMKLELTTTLTPPQVFLLDHT